MRDLPSTRAPRAVGLLVVTALVAVVLVVAHLAAYSTRIGGDGAYLAAVLGAPLLAVVGALRAAPGERRFALLVALGLGTSALGDVIWFAYSWTSGVPDVSVADIPYYVSYLGLGAALLALVATRKDSGARRWDVDAAIDTLTVVVVSVVVLWSVSVRDIVADTSLSVGARVVLGGYPVLDAVLLALVLRLLALRRQHTEAGMWFALGIAGWLASDLGYLLIDVDDLQSAVLDVGWMVGGLLIASVAWDRPSAAVREQPQVRSTRTSLGQLGLAVVPLLLPPVMLTALTVRGREIRPVEGVVGMLLLLSVTVLRVARLLVVEGRTRADLAHARDQALEASRAKSEFLATMSHEIRTPMNGVIGLNELLLTTPLNERQQQYAEGVRTAGRGLLTVINEILDFSKIESGALELESIDFDVVELVEAVAEIVGGPADAKGLELLAYCSPEVPSALHGDPARIRQVLLNLAGNAVKFTESGEVVVRVSLVERTEAGLVLRFEVSDTGIGIAEDARQRLFEPFSQADSSTTRRFGGTGLGLTISSRLVEAMGGELGLESQPDHGSTFWFTLPLEASREADPAPAREPGLLRGQRVLVVDDNATNRAILHDQLEVWGMSVDVVDGPLAGLDRLREAAGAGTPYDLGILDLCMPDLDGLALAKRVAASPELAGTRLVLMTSGPDVSTADAEAAAISAALTKPVLMSRLHAVLVDVVAPPVAPAPPEPSPSTSPATERSAKGDVLVVDDSEVNQIVAVGMLDFLGYDHEVAEDGEQAVEAAQRRPFDAILMDIQMPGMDGYEATRRIRALEDGSRRTPIIALTAAATDGEHERCVAAGMDDYLTKPMSRAALSAALEQWVPVGRA